MNDSPTQPSQTTHARRWAMYGGVLSLGAPLGLWGVRMAFPDEPTVELIYTATSTFVVFVMFGLFAGRLADTLQSVAIRDRLTGLHNRRHMMDALPRLRAITRRRGTALTIMMIDLDRFKLVNDRYGHTVGDQTLIAVAATLAHSLRDADLVARFGGEEFVVAAADSDATAAREMAERVRKAVAALGPDELGHPGPQTISIGVAVSHDDTVDELLRRADDSLYAAKGGGRDRVVVSGVAEPHEASSRP